MNLPWSQCFAMIRFAVKCLNQSSFFINTHRGRAGQADLAVKAEWRFDLLNLSLTLDLYEVGGAYHHLARAGLTCSQQYFLGHRLSTVRYISKGHAAKNLRELCEFLGIALLFL